MSDGIGSWVPSGWSRADCKLIKLLFSPEGAHLGYLITRLSFTLTSLDTFDAEGETDIVLGEDLDGEVTFTGPLALRGTRLKVDAPRR
jgi:hypothetical protein